MPRSPSNLFAVILAMITLISPLAPVLAQDGWPVENPTRNLKIPLGTSIIERVVWSHDFDEPNNPANFPKQAWVRIGDIQSPDRHFPLWNPVGFIPAAPVPGQKINRQFSLGTKGGSTGMKVVAGVIPALPNTDYMIRIDARTLGLDQARGRVVTSFLDTSGDLIVGTERTCLPFRTAGDWETIGIVLEGDYEQVAWIEIRLLLEQPSQWRTEQPFAQEIRHQDISGSVEFDNLYVWRLPRVELYATSTNVIPGLDPFEVIAHLQDVAHTDMVGRLRSYNIDGQLIDDQTASITPGSGPTKFKLQVPAYGWYRSSLEVSENGTIISNTLLDIAVIPDDRDRPGQRATNFGIMADAVDPRAHQYITQYMEALRVSDVTLAIWPRMLPRAATKSYISQIEPMIANLSRNQFHTSFSVNVLPAEASTMKNLDQHKVFSTMARNDEKLWDMVDEFLIAFGQLVPRWQVGPSFGASLFQLSSIEEGLETITRRLSELVPQPVMILPWRADEELPPPTVLDPMASGSSSRTQREFIVQVPEHIDSAAVDEHLWPWVESGVEFAAVIEPLDATVFGFRNSVIDLVKRTVSAAESGTKRLLLPHPWRQDDGRRPLIMPTHLFPVWRVLADQLDGREAVGRLRLLDGIEAIIFRDATGFGTIVIWNDSSLDDTFDSRVNWGEMPIRVIDPFGNSVAVERVDGEHHLPIGRMPLFIEGADINLALFMASLNVTPRVVESSAKVQEHHIVIGNPWNTAITGEIAIVEPAHWEIRPRIRSFTVPPGGEERVPVRFSLPTFELAGEHILVLEATFQADRFLQTRVRIPLEVGHERVILSPSYRFEKRNDGTVELVVICDVSNSSDLAAWVTAFVVGEGFSRKEADITNLQPSESTRRIFRIPNGEQFRGTTMRIGLQEINGPGRLNLLLPID